MSQHPPQSPPPYTAPSPLPTSLPPRRRKRHLFDWIVFIALAVCLFMLLSQKRNAASVASPRGTAISLSEFTARLETNQVRRVVVTRDEVRGEFVQLLWTPGDRSADTPDADGLHFHADLPNGLGESWGFIDWLLTHRGDAVVTAENDSGNVVLNILLPIIPWLLIFGFIWFFVFRGLRRAGAATIPPTIADSAALRS